MKRFWVPLLLLATSGFAQEARKAIRLESFTWNPATNKLSWVVSEGRVNRNDDFVPEDRRFFYNIDMDAAVMFHEGDGRRFSEEEADAVSAVLHLLSRYTLESAVWWQGGQNELVDPKLPADEGYSAGRPTRSPPRHPLSL